jgi:signal transduction histidine kinase
MDRVSPQLIATHDRADVDSLLSLAERLRGHFELEGLLAEIIELCCRVVDAQAASVVLIDEEKGDLYFHTVHGGGGDQLHSVRLESGQGIAGWVIEHRTTANVGKVQEDPRFARLVDDQTAFETRALMCAPMLVRDQVIGCVEVINKTGDGAEVFDEADKSALEILTRQAALAIDYIRAQKRLVQQDRLATIGAVAAAIIHDLRSPLMAIRIYADLLQDEFPDGAELTQEVHVACNRIGTMVNDILEFSRGEQLLSLEDQDAGSLVAQVAKDLELIVRNRKGVTVRLSCEDGCVLSMDVERMRRVLSNLASNALHAIGDEGVIELSVRKQPDQVVFTVRDDGCGMDAETQTRLFEQSFTQTAGGFGLGMAVVKSTVEAHGGSVEVASAPGAGTTISLRLPAGLAEGS